MFIQPGAGGNVRPFLVGFLLLMVFLSMQAEWSPAPKPSKDWEATGGKAGTGPKPRGVKEMIVYELSVSNEKLERENAALRQHVLDLRRAARAAGCALNGSITYFPLPGLEDALSSRRNASAGGTVQDSNTLPDGGGSKPLAGHTGGLTAGGFGTGAIGKSQLDERMRSAAAITADSDHDDRMAAVNGGKRRRYQMRRTLLGITVRPLLKVVTGIRNRYLGTDERTDGFDDASRVVRSTENPL